MMRYRSNWSEVTSNGDGDDDVDDDDDDEDDDESARKCCRFREKGEKRKWVVFAILLPREASERRLFG